MFRQKLTTYIYRLSILHSRGDESAPTRVNAVLLVSLSALYFFAVDVNADSVALYGNAQLVPLAIKERMKVTASKYVAESVFSSQALRGKLHHLLNPVNQNRHL